MFRFILSLWLFLRNQHIILFNPSSYLNDAVLQFLVVSSFVVRLRKTNRSDVFLALYLSINERIINTIKQSLINRPLICDNRVFLVLPVIYGICHHQCLTIWWEEVVNYCLHQGLCYVLLYQGPFVHSIWIVVHRPSTTLSRLVCKHSDTFCLHMIHEWRY